MSHQFKIPTIIIGLGGTGGRIVDQLARFYFELSPEYQNNIPTEFLIIDTDVNDLNNLKNIAPHKKFRISKNLSVDQYIQLHNNGKDIEDWFPIHYQYLHNKTLLEGAGQIRLLGRLALYAMFEHPNFENRISSEIRNTLRQWHGPLGNLRIYLVGSICGGTASGILIPLTFWLHHEFQAHYPMIKGIFFLPKVYINAYNLPSNQHSRLKINAYAALKEIENMFRFIYGLYDHDHFEITPRPLNFTFHPNHPDFTISTGSQFFKMVYLIDFENMHRQHLARNGEEYEKMVVHGLFNQLYTPIASVQGSIEDNNIIETLQRLGQEKVTNVYCTFGVSTIEYPYEDLMDYFAHQYSIYTISKNWLKIDKEFELRKKNYNMQRDQGILNLPEPRLEKEFIDILEKLRENDSFFNDIYNEFNIIIEETNQVINLSDQYIDALKKHILNLVRDNEIYFEFSTKYSQGIPVEDDQPELTIAQIERDFEEMELKLNQPGDMVSDIAFRQSILVGAETPDNQLMDIHLQKYIRNNSPHPIGVRYFLYRTMLRLEYEIKELEKTLNQQKKQIDRYKEAFDDPATKEIEDAVQRIRQIQSSFFEKLKNKSKFLKYYRNEASSHVEHLKRYMETYAVLQFFKRIHDEIDNIAEEYETFFDSLTTLMQLVHIKIEELENLHDVRQQNSFKQYVFASADIKKKLWDKEKIELSALNDTTINQEIYNLLFTTYMNRHRQHFSNSRRRKVRSTYPQKFMSVLIPRCRQVVQSAIGNKYDLNIAEILYKQIEMEHPDSEKTQIQQKYADRIKSLMHSLFNRAEGYLPIIDDNQVQSMLLLGIHKDVYQYFSNSIEHFDSFITQEAGVQTITDSFFSNRIVQAYRVRYSITAKDIEGFQFPDGEYFRAYQKCVKNILQSKDPERFPKDVFPHLDKKWHKYGYMPGLSEEEIRLYHTLKLTAAIAARITNTIDIQPSLRKSNEVKLSIQFPGELVQEWYITPDQPSKLATLNKWLDEEAGYIPRLIARYQEWSETLSSSGNQQANDNFSRHAYKVWNEILSNILEERGNPHSQKLIYAMAKKLLQLHKHFIFVQTGLSEEQKFQQLRETLKEYQQFIERHTQLNQTEQQNLNTLIDAIESESTEEITSAFSKQSLLL